MKKSTRDKAAHGGPPSTAQPLKLPTASDPDSGSPCDWKRLPKPKSRLLGLSRTTWNELLDDGKVKGVTIRKRQARRGIRLIYWPSAEAYLRSLLDKAAAAGECEAE
jgi:hypothetical protein